MGVVEIDMERTIKINVAEMKNDKINVWTDNIANNNVSRHHHPPLGAHTSICEIGTTIFQIEIRLPGARGVCRVVLYYIARTSSRLKPIVNWAISMKIALLAGGGDAYRICRAKLWLSLTQVRRNRFRNINFKWNL